MCMPELRRERSKENGVCAYSDINTVITLIVATFFKMLGDFLK